MNTLHHCLLISFLTPQRSNGFISQGWGWRTSDVDLYNNSGLLSKLLLCDVILADRCTIQEAAGQKLMLLEDSHRCIHVDRVIKMMQQKYMILTVNC